MFVRSVIIIVRRVSGRNQEETIIDDYKEPTTKGDVFVKFPATKRVVGGVSGEVNCRQRGNRRNGGCSEEPTDDLKRVETGLRGRLSGDKETIVRCRRRRRQTSSEVDRYAGRSLLDRRTARRARGLIVERLHGPSVAQSTWCSCRGRVSGPYRRVGRTSKAVSTDSVLSPTCCKKPSPNQGDRDRDRRLVDNNG